MPHAQFIAGLIAIVGRKGVLEQTLDMAGYVRDWSGDFLAEPICVVRPDSTAQVSEVLRLCALNGIHVVPQGGNTGLVGGTQAEAAFPAILLNLGRMNRVRRIDVMDFSIEVEAGSILQSVQEIAAGQNRLFPLSFGAEGAAQIGGIIATNAGGLNVLRYGMVRDLVLGLEVVLPDGQVLDTLTQLRKNNIGLDPKHLFIGTEGTLGIITAASLKLFPAINQRETAFVALPDMDSITPFYAAARTECADLLSAFEFIPEACIALARDYQPDLRHPLPGADEVYVLMELASSGPLDLRTLLEGLLAPAIESGLICDAMVATSGEQAAGLWKIREVMVEAQAARGRHLRTDLSVPISGIPALIHQGQDLMARIAPDWTVLPYGHVGDGNVHFNALPPAALSDAERKAQIDAILGQLYALADAAGGSISAEHGIGRSRRDAWLLRQTSVLASLGLGLKSLLDPHVILNPDCLFPAPTPLSKVQEWN